MKNFDAPTFYFAVTDVVEKNCPTVNSGKELIASDFVPKQSTERDVGCDVRCAAPDGIILEPGKYFMIPLGFRMFAPDNWWLFLTPRSSTFTKSNIQSLYGVIDSSFSSQLHFAGTFCPDTDKLLTNQKSLKINFGDRTAQVIPMPRYFMPSEQIHNKLFDELVIKRNDPRGFNSGFGASGKV